VDDSLRASLSPVERDCYFNDEKDLEIFKE
jgi:hypothetical protein